MKKLLILLVILFLVGYGLFEMRKLLEGPEITIAAPLNGSATSTGLVTITGTAQNIAFLTINDAPAYTDPQGHFAETFSPPSGYTVVTVAGTDRFGRRTSKVVAFTVTNYCPLS